MGYALVKNGKIEEFSGNEKANVPGWVLIEDNGPPPYDPITQHPESHLEIQGTKVVMVYTIKNVLPPLQEQVDNLTSTLQTKGVLTASEVSNTKKPKNPGPPT